MPWFINKSTGVLWHIENENMLNLVAKNPEFEQTEPPSEKAPKVEEEPKKKKER